MIERQLAETLRGLAGQFPVISLVGPRQSGKTTLVRALFREKDYVNVELPDEREFALEDPRGFLSRFPDGAVIDEIQRTPELFSYLQVDVDEDRRAGKWILTGSQNFLLMERISQTLAGRSAPLHLLPLSMAELSDWPGCPDWSWSGFLLNGFYPRIYDQGIDAPAWYSSYVQTFVERDVRSLANIGDLGSFMRFVRLCAARSGQLLNYNNLAVDAGISQPTAKSWISILEAAGLIALVQPYFENFSKRLVKTPKLYWLDSGLLCRLLRIGDASDLLVNPYKGAVFESFVISEAFKAFRNSGKEANIYFWRDRSGHEVDLLIAAGPEILPVEIKSSETMSRDYLNNIKYLSDLAGSGRIGGGAVVYAGIDEYSRSGFDVVPWRRAGNWIRERIR
jgi:hypothetical protein